MAEETARQLEGKERQQSRPRRFLGRYCTAPPQTDTSLLKHNLWDPKNLTPRLGEKNLLHCVQKRSALSR